MIWKTSIGKTVVAARELNRSAGNHFIGIYLDEAARRG
jgi:hypothetical protein